MKKHRYSAKIYSEKQILIEKNWRTPRFYKSIYKAAANQVSENRIEKDSE